MCGIIGYTGKNNDACLKVLNGLKHLEYRGYDSAGIYLTDPDKESMLYKSQGKIANLEELIKNKDTSYHAAIAHTRWATHGVPNEINAHPHKVGSVCLVHNGIIENYNELKNILTSNGYTFESQTDTVVACAYIDYILKNNKNLDKFEIISKACSNFTGSYAFAIIFDDEPLNIYLTRKNSPLIIGISDEGKFGASDISAILDYTNKYIDLEKGEIARINAEGVLIKDENNNILQKEVKTADFDKTKYDKNGYEHYMLKEINEQPEVVRNIYDKYLAEDSVLNKIDFTKYESIDIVACGSAWHAGMVGKYLIENYAKIRVNCEIASEYRYKELLINENSLVIIISQSGETADTIAAMREAKEKNATILGIVNAVGSTIARESDILLYTNAGPEIAVATTKGYTSQVALLSIIALKLAKNKISKDFEDEIISDMKNFYKNVSKAILKIDDAELVAKDLYTKNDIFFIGRGIDYALSLEGSLKLKEISYLHSEAYAAGELKHGTISLIEEGTPVIAIATDKKLLPKTISNIKETKARGAYIIYITTDELDTEEDFYDKKIVLPSSSIFTSAITIVSMLQLISYYTAKNKGCDIDKPKNLAKSVTVE